MKIFCTFPAVNISKLNFWLVICICIVKDIVWTTLKAIFSIFRFVCTLRFQIFKELYLILNIVLSLQIIHQWKDFRKAFRWCINLNLKKMYPYDWFCGPGANLFNQISALPTTTMQCMQYTVLDDTKSACSLCYCSTARANATEWSYGRTARNKEEERTAEECGGDGPAVHEQKQAFYDGRAGLTCLFVCFLLHFIFRNLES